MCNRGYDAYEKDIAVLNVFFDTQAIMEFQTQATQVFNWTLQIREQLRKYKFNNSENSFASFIITKWG